MSGFPKDTKNELFSPWSSLVLAMNISGSFSYTLSGRGAVGDQSPQHNHLTYSEQLRYSNLLFLWGVFTCPFRVACSLHLIRAVFPQFMKPDIASMAMVYCCFAWIMVGAIIPTILLARSGQLASILEQSMFSSVSQEGGKYEQEDIQIPTGWKRFKRISNWTTLIAMVGFIVYSYWLTFYIVEMNTVSEIMVLGIFIPCYVIGTYAAMELIKSFLKLSSIRLVASAKNSLHTFIQATERTDELVGPNVNMIMKSLHRINLQVRSVSTACITLCRYRVYCMYLSFTKMLPV